MKTHSIFLAALAGATLLKAQASFKYDFSAKTKSDWTHVEATNVYITKTGFGFEPGAEINSTNFAASEKPFLFSVALPEGNYAVTVLLNGQNSHSVTTVKSEQRRLMLEKISGTNAQTFIVNVRRPRISDYGSVKLKVRELETETVNWDEKLTLEFNGKSPTLRSLIITPTNVPTLFIAGDSTVCDQPAEPWNSWGQMLPRFFKPEIAVANYAESGESMKSSLGAKRFEKIFSLMNKGDYLFLQFGHNDMKDKATNALVTYKTNLKQIVARTRELGGTPVLVTSMERKNGLEHDTLAGYPQTVRDVAQEEKCVLIDLHSMSRIFYRALGGDLDQAFQDGTHHNNYGSYELAKCVTQSIRESQLPLAKWIVEDFGVFNPAKPDAVKSFEMPISPNVSKEKPLGN